jgi:hypothetical protein
MTGAIRAAGYIRVVIEGNGRDVPFKQLPAGSSEGAK